jgi:ribose transport system substrate-binding protein
VHPGLPIAMVGTDQKEVGRIQGRQCRALCPGGGRALCVRGPEYSSVAADRFTGLQEALGAGFEVRALNGDWTDGGGEHAVASWLRLSTATAFRPDVVACQNDSMAVGARRALARHHPGWGSAPFLGCDGLPEGGQKMVAVGELAATIVTASNTGPALELVSRWMRTGEIPPAEILLPPRSYPPEQSLRPGRKSS